MSLSWKSARWVCIVIALIVGLLLTGIAEATSPFSLTYDFLGFELGMLLGLASFASAWILYKVL